MKKLIGILALCAVLLVFGLYAYFADRSPEWYGNFVDDHRDVLMRMAGGELDSGQSLQAKFTCFAGGIESVMLTDTQARFYLKYAAIEGHTCLVYAPEADVPTCISFYDNWVPAETDGTYLRWEGGMGSRAYVNLYDLGESFYLEEAYLPT